MVILPCRESPEVIILIIIRCVNLYGAFRSRKSLGVAASIEQMCFSVVSANLREVRKLHNSLTFQGYSHWKRFCLCTILMCCCVLYCEFFGNLSVPGIVWKDPESSGTMAEARKLSKSRGNFPESMGGGNLVG